MNVNLIENSSNVNKGVCLMRKEQKRFSEVYPDLISQAYPKLGECSDREYWLHIDNIDLYASESQATFLETYRELTRLAKKNLISILKNRKGIHPTPVSLSSAILTNIKKQLWGYFNG